MELTLINRLMTHRRDGQVACLHLIWKMSRKRGASKQQPLNSALFHCDSLLKPADQRYCMCRKISYSSVAFKLSLLLKERHGSKEGHQERNKGRLGERITTRDYFISMLHTKNLTKEILKSNSRLFQTPIRQSLIGNV